MKKVLKNLLFLLILFISCPLFTSAQIDIPHRLSGRFLVQVQAHGEAWYVNPVDLKRYYLGRPLNAFTIMQKFGLGVKHQFILNNTIFPAKVHGRILIDVEDRGKAYYIYPKDGRAYYLGKPLEAFTMVKKLALGISNNDIGKIIIGYIPSPNNNSTSTIPCSHCSNSNIMDSVATAIRQGNTTTVINFFTLEMKKVVEFTMNFLDATGKLTLSNLFSSAILTNATTNEKIYTNEMYFSAKDSKVPVRFYIRKQTDGTWKLTNL